MKKTLLIGLLAITALLYNSCKKEDNKTNPTPNPSNNDTTEKIIEIKTAYGTMYMWLYNETPLHKANFLTLADTGFFDSITFHRIVPNFVIQGGDPNSKDADPNNDGNGGPGYTIPAEITTALKHTYGAVGAARLPNNVNPQRESSGSQFYIVVNPSGTSNLNGDYTVFGKILSGMSAATSIVAQPRSGTDRPLSDIRMDVNVVTKTRAQLRSEFNFEAK